MTNPTPQSETQQSESQKTLPSPLSCLSGAVLSGGFAFALYLLTSSIAQTFAEKPISSSNPTAINMSVLVRTLVVGVSTLATGIFSIVAVGLVALAIQSAIGQWKNRSASSPDPE